MSLTTGAVPESAAMSDDEERGRAADRQDRDRHADHEQEELFEAALRRIRERVAARTLDGTYPLGLDAELDAHFERLAALGRLDDVEAASAAVARLRNAPRLAVER